MRLKGKALDRLKRELGGGIVLLRVIYSDVYDTFDLELADLTIPVERTVQFLLNFDDYILEEGVHCEGSRLSLLLLSESFLGLLEKLFFL